MPMRGTQLWPPGSRSYDIASELDRGARNFEHQIGEAGEGATFAMNGDDAPAQQWRGDRDRNKAVLGKGGG